MRSLQIPFYLLYGGAKEQVPLFVTKHNVSVVVCDMSPLRTAVQWYKDVATELKKLKLPVVQVSTLVWPKPHCVIRIRPTLKGCMCVVEFQ